MPQVATMVLLFSFEDRSEIADSYIGYFAYLSVFIYV